MIPCADAPRRAHLEGICRRYGLDALYAFGSRAAQAAASVRTGAPLDARSRSDLDVGVLPRAGHRLDAHARVTLTTDLEAAFDDVAAVDLVMLPEASAYLALDVIQGELLVALDKRQEAEYELFVLRRAGDLAPFERERRRLVLAGGRG